MTGELARGARATGPQIEAGELDPLTVLVLVLVLLLPKGD